MSDDEPKSATGKFLLWGRRGLLAALLAWGACVLLHDGVPRVCHEVVADKSVVQVCEPMGATDPRALLFLLFVILLLFPELSEMELAGVLTLKRRLSEARTEVAEVKGELAQIRTQAAAAATAHLQAGLHNEFHLTLAERQKEVGKFVLNLTNDQPGTAAPKESTGAYAQLAFEAGLAGLIQLMPDWAAHSLLLGFTTGDDGSPELTYFAGSQSPALNAAVDQIQPSLSEGTTAALDECWAAMAPARDDDGSVVGAIAILVPHADVPVGEDGVGGDEQHQVLAVWAEIVANGYARLLIDILGEQPVPGLSSHSGSEEEQ